MALLKSWLNMYWYHSPIFHNRLIVASIKDVYVSWNTGALNKADTLRKVGINVYYKQYTYVHMFNSSGLSLLQNIEYVCRTIIIWQGSRYTLIHFEQSIGWNSAGIIHKNVYKITNFGPIYCHFNDTIQTFFFDNFVFLGS